MLRRRFSNQRHNESTSSSGTGGALNTCSSTDSSLDALNFTHPYDSASRRSTGGALNSPLPRFAISPCKDPHHLNQNSSGGQMPDVLSPVDEVAGVAKHQRKSSEVLSLVFEIFSWNFYR